MHPPAGASGAQVEVAGAVVARDATHVDGWDLIGGTVLQLYGAACEAASAPGATVRVVWACKH